MDKHAVVSPGCARDHVCDLDHTWWDKEDRPLAPLSSWVEAYPPKTDNVGLRIGQEMLHYVAMSTRDDWFLVKELGKGKN